MGGVTKENYNRDSTNTGFVEAGLGFNKGTNFAGRVVIGLGKEDTSKDQDFDIRRASPLEDGDSLSETSLRGMHRAGSKKRHRSISCPKNA